MATSTVSTNLTEVIIDPFGGHPSPSDCGILKVVTVYSVFMFSSSFISNSLLLYAFIKNKEVRSPVNMFIMALSICNIFATLSEGQVIIASTFMCK